MSQDFLSICILVPCNTLIVDNCHLCVLKIIRLKYKRSFKKIQGKIRDGLDVVHKLKCSVFKIVVIFS